MWAMRFRDVSIATVAHVDAPVRLTSAAIVERLRPTLDRLGIRGDLLEEVAGIRARRVWDGPLAVVHGRDEPIAVEVQNRVAILTGHVDQPDRALPRL